MKQQTKLNDLHADNIYLKGGSNMAEALIIAKQDNINAGGMSIAMRMKKNRELALNGGYAKQKEDEAIFSKNVF